MLTYHVELDASELSVCHFETSFDQFVLTQTKRFANNTDNFISYYGPRRAE